MTCGVYEIRHDRTQRRYVGSSAEIERRWAWHRTMLRTGKHHCDFLQNVWNKYLPEEFSFSILEECSTESLAEREQFHMDATAKGKLMNSQPTARSSRGYQHSPEAKRKMSEAAKRVAQDPEERQRRSERAKAQHASGVLGTLTPEMREKMSKGLKTAWASGKFESTAQANRDRSRATTSEEMRRRSYQRKMFAEKEQSA